MDPMIGVPSDSEIASLLQVTNGQGLALCDKRRPLYGVYISFQSIGHVEG